MSRSTHMVRPKAKTLPRMETWVVSRRCPVTRVWESFDITCVEGSCLDIYRKLGLDRDGHVWDPIADLEAGRLRRRKISVSR